jgi:hypothetical protein
MTAQPIDLPQGPPQKPGAAKRELSQREVAQYTADMMLELRQLCKNVELATLQALIELVYYEAYATANPVLIPEAELARLREMETEGKKVAGLARSGPF